MAKFILMAMNVVVAWGVSPPWDALSRQLKNSIGLSACVRVGDFDATRGVVPVQACSQSAAEGLRLALRRDYKLGQPVTVVVLDPGGNELPAPVDPGADAASSVERKFHDALDGNPMLVGVTRQEGFYSVGVELHKQVIQYWDDNLSDHYGNVNYVARDLFAKVLDLKPFGRVQVGLSTARE